MQGLLALTMHCADTVIDYKNDERSWQEAFTRYAESADAFVPPRYRIRWLTVFLIVIKTGIQWTFSYAVTVNSILSVALIPLIIVTVLIFMVAILLEIIARRVPRGGAPTTYGGFSLLIEFVTRYHLVWL